MYDLFCEIHPHRKLNSKGKCRTCQQSASQNKTQYTPRPVTNTLQKAKEITHMSETKSLEQQLQAEKNRIKQSLKTNKEYLAISDDILQLTEVWNQTNNLIIGKLLADKQKQIAEFETSPILEELYKKISDQTATKNEPKAIQPQEIDFLHAFNQMLNNNQIFISQLLENNQKFMLQMLENKTSKQIKNDDNIILFNENRELLQQVEKQSIEISELKNTNRKLDILLKETQQQNQLRKISFDNLNKRIVDLEKNEIEYNQQINNLNTINQQLNTAVVELEKNKALQINTIDELKIKLKEATNTIIDLQEQLKKN